jgi:hypothetical protein
MWGGGVKPQGSGDAGMAGQAQAGQTSQGLPAPGREPNSRSGAVTTVTLAIQVVAQIARSVVTIGRSVRRRSAYLTAGVRAAHWTKPITWVSDCLTTKL